MNFKKAKELLIDHDGERFTATQMFIAAMRDSDLSLITDFCLKQERLRSKEKDMTIRRLNGTID